MRTTLASLMGIALAFSSPLDNNDSMPPFTGRVLSQNWPEPTPAPTTPRPTRSPVVLADGIFIANDITIREAVSLWLSDPPAAEASYGLISTWETGGVTDMAYLFCGSQYYSSSGCNTAAASFNEDISAWDTSGVTRMDGMFRGALSFNGDIGGWAVHSVTQMGRMFEGASAFNQDLGWCVDDGVSLWYAFDGTLCASTSCGVGNPAALWCGGTMGHSSIRTAVKAWLADATAAEATYGHISTWNTGRVTDMRGLFSSTLGGGGRDFNEPIGNWDVRKVKNMEKMFEYAESFNQALGKWQVGAVTDVRDMFQRAVSFNQPLNDWDLSNVQNMEEIFKAARAFDQDLGWCVGWDVNLEDAFKKSKCESALCGVAHRDAIGICEPFARPCLIATKTQCIINSPTIIIALVVLLAGFGACVHWRKKKDETYVAAARRLLYSCLCCCCLCCRKKTESSSVTSSRPDSPAELPPELGPEEPDEEETRAAAEETTVEESGEPSSISKLTSFLFGKREEAPTEEAPKEEEEAAALPVFAEAEEEATEQPPPPPARRWFSRAEPEPAAPKAEEMHQRMASWYSNAPEAAALRSTWGAFPEPDEFQTWPGFVAVTNAFLDRQAGEPEA